MNPPQLDRVCGYLRCSMPLNGMNSKAIYCSRSHKEAAKQARDGRRVEPGTRTRSCKICGDPVAVEASVGALPKYCANHHPKQPCAGCGKILRHLAVSQFCRGCRRLARKWPEQVWTRLCDSCGEIFEGPPSTQFCFLHTAKPKDER